jgi:ATP-dependent RNA helicase DDX21
MLNMGFADDVEAILKSATDSTQVQTLLFSATMPSWVKDMQRKYLNSGSVYVDLVGSDKMKASRSVEHKVLYAHWSQRAEIIQDLVNCYGCAGALLCHIARDVPGRASKTLFAPALVLYSSTAADVGRAIRPR